MKEIKNEPDGMYYDHRTMFVKIETKVRESAGVDTRLSNEWEGIDTRTDRHYKYSMTTEQTKEANRYFWIIKGHLIPEGWSDIDIEEISSSYFKRIWGNHEACFREEGFEEAWSRRNISEVLR